MCYLVGTALKFDIHSKLKSIASVERCHERCQLANGCTHFTFKGSSCYLKTNNSTSLPDKDAISGPKHCPTARWSPWSQWSNHCEGICDNGTNYRIRECLRDMNHASCLGNSKETRICDLPLCPNKTEGTDWHTCESNFQLKLQLSFQEKKDNLIRHHIPNPNSSLVS